MYELINNKTGQKLRCDFLTATPESTEILEGIRQCIRDEYGETYSTRIIYDINAFAEEIQSGKSLAMLAVSETGDPVASLALRHCGGFKDVPELTMHVVCHAYRGFGIGTVFTKALLDNPFAKGHSSVTAHSVTFHPKAQHQTLNCGLVPTGFLFLVHSNELVHHTFDVTGCPKQSFAVGVYTENKRDAGTIYIPQEHRDFAEAIYSRLDVKVSFGQDTGEYIGEADFNTHTDNIHHTLDIEIFNGGEELEVLLKDFFSQKNFPDQTANAVIDMNSPSAVRTYRLLADYGFFFAGLQPLCGNGEFMIMHNPMKLKVPFDKLCIDDGYRDIFDYVRDMAQGGLYENNQG